MNKFELIQISCRACNKTNHTVNDCKMIHGTPNRSKVLLNYRRQIPMDRINFKRSNHRINSINEQIGVQESVLHFLSNYSEYFYQLLEIKNGNAQLCQNNLELIQVLKVEEQICMIDNLEKNIRNYDYPENRLQQYKQSCQHKKKLCRIDFSKAFESSCTEESQLKLDNIKLSLAAFQYSKKNQNDRSNIQTNMSPQKGEETLKTGNSPEVPHEKFLKMPKLTKLRSMASTEYNKNQLSDQEIGISSEDKIEMEKFRKGYRTIIITQPSDQVQDKFQQQMKKEEDQQSELLEQEIENAVKEVEDKIGGQYPEIFYWFDKFKNYEFYFEKNNIAEIIQEQQKYAGVSAINFKYFYQPVQLSNRKTLIKLLQRRRLKQDQPFNSINQDIVNNQ